MITTYAIVVLSLLYFSWKFRSMKVIIFGFMIILGLVAIIMMNDLISDRLLDSFDLSNSINAILKIIIIVSFLDCLRQTN